MKSNGFEVAVIGAGLSGLSAAGILKEHELDILIVEENDRIGGQYLKAHPLVTGLDPDPMQGIVGQLVELDHPRIKVLTRSRVLAMEGTRELLLEQGEQRLYVLQPAIVLLATGARERFMPFKGWTLPGVMSIGAVQILLKGSGVLPAANPIIGGTGVFLYRVAAEVIEAGGSVRAIFDEAPFLQKIRFLEGLFGQEKKIKEGLGAFSRILFSRTRMRHRHRIIEAAGEDRLEEVRVAKMDGSGNPVPGTDAVYPCECLAIGSGFTANIELGVLAGCNTRYDAAKGGWIIAAGETLETSVPGIFAAGEVVGIGGAAKAIAEGKRAAYSILHRLGRIDTSRYLEMIQPLEKERKKHRRFESLIHTPYRAGADYIRSIPDETIICRCEEITHGRIKEAIGAGCRTPASIKRALRTGMGICQGRICGPILSELIWAHTNTPIEKQKPLSVRAPVKAVPLGVLAKPVERLNP